MLTRSQLYVMITSCLVYFCQGYVHAILNGIITMDSFLEQFPETNNMTGGLAQIKTRSLLQGTVVAVLDVGSTIGSILCAVFGDRLGRRKLILGSVATAIVGSVLQVSAFHYPQLVVGRVFSGIGLGSFSATTPMWLAECLDAKNRGKITIFTGVFVTFGFVCSTWIDYGFYALEETTVSWRLPLALQLIPLCAIVFFCCKSTESPRWLVRRNSIDEAAVALSLLKGCKADDDSIRVEITFIQEVAEKETCSQSGSNKTAWRAFLAVWLCVLVTLSGINVVSFFSTELFQTQLGYSPQQSRLFSAGLQMVQLVFALVGCLLVEWLGRRMTMMISAFIMAIAMGALGGIKSGSKGSGIADVFFLFLTMVGYPIGFHSTPYMYCAEIAPLLSRNMIAAGSSAFHWILNFVVAEVTPIAFNNIGASYYFIYMAFNVCTLVCIYLLYPETRGITLEKIDDVFTCSNNPFTMVLKSLKMNDSERLAKTKKRGIALEIAFEEKFEAEGHSESSSSRSS